MEDVPGMDTHAPIYLKAQTYILKGVEGNKSRKRARLSEASPQTMMSFFRTSTFNLIWILR